MSDEPSKEYQAFDSLMRKLVKVPKAALHERLAHHQAQTAAEREANPTRPGRKPKEKAEPVKARQKLR